MVSSNSINLDKLSLKIINKFFPFYELWLLEWRLGENYFVFYSPHPSSFYNQSKIVSNLKKKIYILFLIGWLMLSISTNSQYIIRRTNQWSEQFDVNEKQNCTYKNIFLHWMRSLQRFYYCLQKRTPLILASKVILHCFPRISELKPYLYLEWKLNWYKKNKNLSSYVITHSSYNYSFLCSFCIIQKSYGALPIQSNRKFMYTPNYDKLNNSFNAIFRRN